MYIQTYFLPSFSFRDVGQSDQHSCLCGHRRKNVSPAVNCPRVIQPFVTSHCPLCEAIGMLNIRRPHIFHGSIHVKIAKKNNSYMKVSLGMHALRNTSLHEYHSECSPNNSSMNIKVLIVLIAQHQYIDFYQSISDVCSHAIHLS